MQWNNERALHVIEQLNFPHKVETSEHDRAKDIITTLFRESSPKVAVEEFRYSMIFRWMIRAGNLLVAGLSLGAAGFWEAPATVWVSWLCAVASLFLLALVLSKSTKIVLKLMPRGGSHVGSNIIVDFPPAKNASLMLILGAHYDTTTLHKSYVPVYITRVGIFLIQRLVICLYGLIRMISGWFSLEFFTVLIWILAVAEIILTVVHMTFKRTNTNPGCVDNSSGVASLAEIARNLREQPLDHVHVRLAAFDGEEEGLLGSCAYTLAHRAEMQQQRCWMISLDMVAGRAPLKMVTRSGIPIARHGEKILALFKEANPGTPLKSMWFPYWGSDHAAFYYLRLEQVTWMFTPNKGTHVADTFDTVRAETLQQAGAGLTSFLTRLDKNLKELRA